jgi:hypothetical protein
LTLRCAAPAEIAVRQLDDAAEAERAVAHLRAHADGYPTLAASGHLGPHDWDASFSRGLDYLLHGIGAAAGTVKQTRQPSPAGGTRARGAGSPRTGSRR